MLDDDEDMTSAELCKVAQWQTSPEMLEWWLDLAEVVLAEEERSPYRRLN